jgi:sigma-B regulation protein RsbU (phosphoserine phosphatase)
MTLSTERTIVLIVDDDANNLRLLGLILRDAGYEALAVRDPERVLAVIKAKSPEIVLLDVSMPKINGYDVCRQILAEPGYGRLPIIFLTARTEPEDLIRGFKAGAVDYVTKPFNKTELLERIKNHIDRCRYEKSLADEKDRFRIMTESVAEAFILIGGDMKFIEYVSPAFERIFGFSPPDGEAGLDFLSPYAARDNIEGLRTLLTRTFRQGVPGSMEFQVTRSDGVARWAWIRTTTSMLGGEAKLICVVADITEKKTAELQILRAHEVAARLAGETRKSLSSYETRLRGLGIDSGLLSIPCKNIDGDFFDIFINRETIDIVVGDVMGKGIHAALVSSGARTWFLRARFRFGTGKTGLPSPAVMVTDVDRAMTPHLIGLNSFFTAQYLRIDRDEGYLEFVDCGHTPILVWDGENCWSYKGTNTPIGFFENQKFTTHRLPFGPESVFMVYSDGVTDTVNPSGDSFGEDRLKEGLIRNSGKSASEIIESMKSELEDFAAGAPWKDDITLAAFRIASEPRVPAPLYRRTFILPSSLECLSRVRDLLAEALSSYDDATMNETCRSMAILAVNEAAANIIIHGLKKMPAESFRFAMEVHPSWYSITFSYPGPDFDWARIKKSSVINLDESGYGMDIMRETMFSVLFARNSFGVAQFILTGLPGGNEAIDESW